jgi:flagellar hook-associated protein 3 FlgL
MRIAFDNNLSFLDSVNSIREQLNTTQQQLTTGQSVQMPSDNPIAEAQWITNRAEYSTLDQFSRNLSGLQATSNTQDSAINSIVLTLNQAISLGTQGATGTLNDSDRQAIAQQVTSIQQQLVDLANTSINGTYVFSGSDVTTKPYVLNNASPSGVQYNGNGNAVTAQITPGQSVQVQLPGSQLFGTPGADMFQSIQDLITALQTNGNISGAAIEVRQSLAALDTQRVTVGTALARIQDAGQYLTNQEQELSQQENDLIGADMAKAATDFAREQTALSAALQSGVKVNQLSLMDFLPNQ